MEECGYKPLQNYTALNFAGKILDIAEAMASAMEEKLVLYELVVIFDLYDKEVFDSIRWAAELELKKIPTKERKEVLINILKDLNTRELLAAKCNSRSHLVEKARLNRIKKEL